MYIKPTALSVLFRLLLGSALLAVLTWVSFNVAASSWGGQEFYVQWAAGRMLAFQAKSPYEGRFSIPPLPEFGASQSQSQVLRFNSPIFGLIIIFPFLLVGNFKLAFTLWLVFSVLGVGAVMWTGLTLTGWRPGRMLSLILVFSLAFGYYTFQALASGSSIILMCAILGFALMALQSDRNEAAGFLLALTTGLPQHFILVYAVLVLWAIYKKRLTFVVWFMVSVILLVVIGMFVIPEWPISYLRVLWRFEENFALRPVGDQLKDWLPGIGRQIGWGISIGLLLVCGLEWWSVRRKDFRWLLWTASLTLVASQWVGIPTHSTVFFLLSIPVLLITGIWAQRTAIIGRRLIGVALILFLLLPWLFVFQRGLPQALLEPDLVHLFLLPFCLFVGLYWVRWWTIRPWRLFIEDLRKNETV